jgi:hypothetical protein
MEQKDLSVEELIPKLRVKALTVAVLPGRAGFDTVSLLLCSPAFAQVFGRELGPIVRTYVLRNSLPEHAVSQSADDLDRTAAPFGPDQQALPAVLADQVRDAHTAAIVCSRALTKS